MVPAMTSRSLVTRGDLGVDLLDRRVPARGRRRRPWHWTESTRSVSSATRSCADSRRSMTSRTTSSRSPWRLAREVISRWRFSRSFGRGDGAGVQALLVAGGALAHLVDVLLGLGLLAGGVALLGLRGDQQVAQLGEVLVSDSISACSGSVLRLCASCDSRTSRAWTSRSRIWSAGAAFSWGLLSRLASEDGGVGASRGR